MKSPRLITAHRRPRHSLACRGTGFGHFVRRSHRQSCKNETKQSLHRGTSPLGAGTGAGVHPPGRPQPLRGCTLLTCWKVLPRGKGSSHRVRQGRRDQHSQSPLCSAHTGPLLCCAGSSGAQWKVSAKSRDASPPRPHHLKSAGTLGLEPRSSLAGQAWQYSPHRCQSQEGSGPSDHDTDRGHIGLGRDL